MTKERLLEGMLDLPIGRPDTVARPDQIIEGNQGNVHYVMSKVRVQTLGNLAVFALSCFGPMKEKFDFIKEMKSELGEPLLMEPSSFIAGGYIIFWNARLVEDRLKERD